MCCIKILQPQTPKSPLILCATLVCYKHMLYCYHFLFQLYFRHIKTKKKTLTWTLHLCQFHCTSFFVCRSKFLILSNLSALKTSFNIFLQVINSLNFFFSEKVYISPLLSEEISDVHRTLGWQVSFFQHFKDPTSLSSGSDSFWKEFLLSYTCSSVWIVSFFSSGCLQDFLSLWFSVVWIWCVRMGYAFCL